MMTRAVLFFLWTARPELKVLPSVKWVFTVMFLVSIWSKSIAPKINGVTGGFARLSSFFPSTNGWIPFLQFILLENGTRISSLAGNPATSDQRQLGYPFRSALVCSPSDVGSTSFSNILSSRFLLRLYTYIVHFFALRPCSTFGTFLRIPFLKKM